MASQYIKNSKSGLPKELRRVQESIKGIWAVIVLLGFIAAGILMAYKGGTNPKDVSFETRTELQDAAKEFCTILPTKCPGVRITSKNSIVVAIQFSRENAPAPKDTARILTDMAWLPKVILEGGRRHIHCKGRLAAAFEIEDGLTDYVTFYSRSDSCEN